MQLKKIVEKNLVFIFLFVLVYRCTKDEIFIIFLFKYFQPKHKKKWINGKNIVKFRLVPHSSKGNKGEESCDEERSAVKKKAFFHLISLIVFFIRIFNLIIIINIFLKNFGDIY